GIPESLICRYWIDLSRGGLVVREENYQPGRRLASRLDIKLAPFKVGTKDVWMPVAGELSAYAATVDKKPAVLKDRQLVDNIYVVDGTMQFNQHPGQEVFTIKYKTGTPVSDKLRKLQYEFGQQQISPEPTRAEVKKMLDEQVAMAEAQKTEL